MEFFGMDAEAVGLLLALSVFVGLLVGAVGIGGVLLVPILTYLLGIDVHTAIAAAMFSHMFGGGMGAVMHARAGTIEKGQAIWLSMAAMPGALAGAYAAGVAPGQALEVLVASLVLFGGLHALTKKSDAPVSDTPLPKPRLIGVGLIAGAGSALSGTGGPLIIVPTLIWMRAHARTAVGLSLAAALPISAMATVGNALQGVLDVGLALIISGGQVIGVLAGAKLSMKIPTAAFQKVIAVVLVAVGLFILARLFL